MGNSKVVRYNRSGAIKGKGPIRVNQELFTFSDEELYEMHARLAANIRTFREMSGYSQERLAKAVGVSSRYIYRCENMTTQYLGKKYTRPSISLLYKISKVLGCNFEEFFTFR